MMSDLEKSQLIEKFWKEGLKSEISKSRETVWGTFEDRVGTDPKPGQGRPAKTSKIISKNG
jgi:hypothetical protein